MTKKKLITKKNAFIRLLFSSVNESASLAQVEANVLLLLDTLDLEESGLLVLSAVTSLVAGEYGFHVQTSGWLGHLLFYQKIKSKKQE